MAAKIEDLAACSSLAGSQASLPSRRFRHYSTTHSTHRHRLLRLFTLHTEWPLLHTNRLQGTVVLSTTVALVSVAAQQGRITCLSDTTQTGLTL